MRVSILINNHNYGRFVGRAIESALTQSHADVEVVVVDDGSTDDSPALIRGFGSRVRVIEQRNAGQGCAYNAGFAIATGDLVIFLDADDWLYPQAAAEVAAAWAPGVSKLQFALDMVDREGRPLGRQVPRTMHDREALGLLLQFGAYGTPPGSGNAFAMSYLRQVMPLDGPLWRTAADTVPILMAPAFGELRSIGHALGAYRQHRPTDDGSLISNNAPAGLWQEVDRIAMTKRYVEARLSLMGLRPRQPQHMAPWEARLAALCARFGGPAPSQSYPHMTPAPAQLASFALRSLWHWPAIGVGDKLLQSAWMLGVWLLPRPLAWRLAQQHRQSTGAPVAAPATG